MLFNSYVFLVFFLVVVCTSRVISNWRQRKLFLLAASYLFYAAWNPPFVLLLLISTITDWFVAKQMHRASSARTRKWLLALSLVVNLGMLGYFKYGLFVLDNFVVLLNSCGIHFAPLRPSIILPVGISFYTFQTLSYTFDVFRKTLAPWHSFLDYALYVTFFPQLVAGPIVRAHDFLPQCESPKIASARQLGWGTTLLTIGLFCKVVVADALMAPVVDTVFDAADVPSALQAWVGAFAFSMQIFCDFAGYSSCAIGVAMCLGFALPDNFRCPYASVGFSDFWRRWHITLSSWLRDYLYIPLGGNRRGKLRTLVNLMATMLLGGLWHGASWSFVIWGGLHAVFLAADRLVRKLRFAQLAIWTTRGGQVALSLLTFALVSFAWVFFRATTLDRACVIGKAMVSGLPAHLTSGIVLGKTNVVLVAAFTVATLWLHWLMRGRSLEAAASCLPWWVRSVLLAAMLYAIATSISGHDRAFIYFQF